MAREATAPELALLRTPGQFSRLWLALYKPNVIYTAQLDAVPASTDRVGAITFVSGSGTLANVKPEMTLWVGSTPGARDLGICRIRKAPIAGTFYINLTSEVDWQMGAELTVVDMAHLSGRTPLMDAGTLKLDDEHAYSDQHENFEPVPVLGSHAAVWLTGASVDVNFDASHSWVFDAAINGYSWSAPGSSAIVDGTTATPTITYDAPGHYRVYCTVSADNGTSYTGMRHVFVFDSSHLPHRVELTDSPSAEYDSGGWSFAVRLYADASTTDVVEGTLAVLFSEDWYGSTQQSIGPVVNRENILCMGYVAGESILWDAETSTVEFSIHGAHEALSRIEINPFKLAIAKDTPASWEDMPALTVDRALWHLLHWRTNVTALMDFYPSQDDRYAPALQTSDGTVWDQLNELAFQKILAHGGVDRFGRLFVEIEPQCVPIADRTWATVMTLTKRDWQDRVNINRSTRRKLAMLSTSGWVTDASGTTNVVYSLAMGHVQTRHGRSEMTDQMLASDQTQFNTLTGLYMGWKNVELDLNLTLPQNNRLIDLFPRQYLDITLAEGDTPRGIAYSGNLIPREISLLYDPDSLSISTELSLEPETVAELAVNGDIPPSTGFNSDGWDMSDFPDFEMPDLTIIPDFGTLPPSVENTNHPKNVVIVSTKGVFFTTGFDADTPTWQAMNNGLDLTKFTASTKQMYVTPSGAIWLLVHDTSDYLYRVAKMGGTWSLVATSSDLEGYRITGLAVDPNTSERVAVLSSNPGTNASRLYIGDAGGLSGGSATFGTYMFNTTNAVLFAGGSIYVFYSVYGVFSTPYGARFTTGGALVSSHDINTAVGQDATDRFAVLLPNKFMEWDGSGAGGYNLITPAFVATRYTSISPTRNVQGVAFSPTGVYGMCAAIDGINLIAHLSTDGGASWSPVSGVIPNGSDIWENCKDDNRFIFGGGTTLRLTLNRGGSYVEKSGNLGYIAPLLDIQGIRFIS